MKELSAALLTYRLLFSTCLMQCLGLNANQLGYVWKEKDNTVQ